MFLVFDTETTGLPKNYNSPVSDSDNWPRLVQIAWQLHNASGHLISAENYIVRPDGFDIPFNSAKIHGITTDYAKDHGLPLEAVLTLFEKVLSKSKIVVGQNIEFDLNIVGAEHYRLGMSSPLLQLPTIDTKEDGTEFCAIPGGKGGKYKWPTLTELHQKLFGEGFDAAHNAAADVDATARCFLEMLRIGVISSQSAQFTPEQFARFREQNPSPFPLLGIKVDNYEEALEETETLNPTTEVQSIQNATGIRFAHLHVHSQFSVLEATCDIKATVKKAKSLGMEAVGLADIGNMFGAFAFVDAAEKEGIKPILGYEAYVNQDHTDRTHQDNGYRIPFFAKNQEGYLNLVKMSSIAYTDGFYYKPRIDKNLVAKYKKEVIVTTGGLYGEIPSLLLNVGEAQAEEAFCWWHQQFGEDFYIEINRHGLEEEAVVNKKLLEWAAKYDVKYFASSECYYLEEEDYDAHDILLCVKDGASQSMPLGRGRGFRFGMPNHSFYFKSKEEMAELFQDLPKALSTVESLVDSIESYQLKRDVLLPAFDIPKEFESAEDVQDGGKRGENAYLRHLTYVGAEHRYPEITEEIRERIDFELATVAKTGYPGYFLIVQDFTAKARELGVSVGPGRGSAAGSVVAYCTGITNVDPLKYGLLFERFLNPDRVSLPDIDIDFDDVGRDRVIQYVIDKYGRNQVAQIITYGTMAAKSAIRDASRVKELPLDEVNRLAKLVPDNSSLDLIFNTPENELKEKFRPDDLMKVEDLRKIVRNDGPLGKMLRSAVKIEGSLRNTGIHACGVIITPTDMTDLVPVMTPKDSFMMATQFDNAVVESAGLLKMDFLGLKTLSIITTALKLVEKNYGERLDPDDFPLDDEETIALFARGETNGLFQFESLGMQKNLKLLKPTVFEDIIAMNALYRPGPMEYIPSFAARKNGLEEIVFDLEDMSEVLAETYGITVYQEQVMQLSRILGGFTRGEADKLRKAMGKKIKAQLDELKPKFMKGAMEKGHPEKVLEKIWEDWEKFAKYAFNKSHAACYSVVAWQTAYLKAHYPSEFMAAVLTHNRNDIKKVSFYMEECKRMGLRLLGPDVNYSDYDFTATRAGEVRFGLGGMSGVGGAACENIVQIREKDGPYKSYIDFLQRADLRAVNKQTLSKLVEGGAFDSLSDNNRSVFFYEEEGRSFLDKSIRYAQSLKEIQNSSQVSLFGEESAEMQPDLPFPDCPPWERALKLKKEREVLGVYISSHPLDDFKSVMKYCTNTDLKSIKDIMDSKGRELCFVGMVSAVKHGITKRGKEYGVLTFEDYQDSFEVFMMDEEYLKNRHFFEKDRILFVKALREFNENSQKVYTKVRKIGLVPSLLKEDFSKLQILISLDSLDGRMLEDLDSILHSDSQKEQDEEAVKEVSFLITHKDYRLPLSSKQKMKIQVDERLLASLASSEYEFKLS